MLTNIELCLNSVDLKIIKSNLYREIMYLIQGQSVPVFSSNQTKEEHHG